MNQSAEIFYTTREAGLMLGVSLRTVQLWAESGVLETWKTEGGHRRISRASIQRLLAERDGQAGRTPAASLGALKVLIVEDDSVLLKLYKLVIASWNLPITVTVASNGVEGLICVGRDAPDLMVVDVSMPDMNGLQLIRSLAGSTFREGMEIVVVTGLDGPAIEERGGLAPGVQLFHKPVPFNELRAIAVAMIERRASYL